jgi:hypothetical protein
LLKFPDMSGYIETTLGLWLPSGLLEHQVSRVQGMGNK